MNKTTPKAQCRELRKQGRDGRARRVPCLGGGAQGAGANGWSGGQQFVTTAASGTAQGRADFAAGGTDGVPADVAIGADAPRVAAISHLLCLSSSLLPLALREPFPLGDSVISTP